VGIAEKVLKVRGQGHRQNALFKQIDMFRRCGVEANLFAANNRLNIYWQPQITHFVQNKVACRKLATENRDAF